jgi:hypothetical protein
MREIIEARVEIERELQMRAGIYPRLVLQGRLTQTEADRRTRALRYALFALDTALDLTNHTQPTTTE